MSQPPRMVSIKPRCRKCDKYHVKVRWPGETKFTTYGCGKSQVTVAQEGA